jgi:hypothetical protein
MRLTQAMSRFTRYLLFSLALAAQLQRAELRAESDWIRAGSFIDWPASLQADAVPDEQDWPETDDEEEDADALSPRAIPAAFTSSEEMIVETALVDEEPELMPEVAQASFANSSGYDWQILPQGLLYHSYLAGENESRLASQWLWDRDRGLFWNAVLGGRVGLLRHGTHGWNGEGFQFDVEGAAILRIDPCENSDPLQGTDYRCGFVGTWRKGRWRWKAGISHVSSHLGDEFLLTNPGFNRLNYVRDSFLVGTTFDYTPDWQFYGEVAYAANHSGGAEPLELQFGSQYSPAMPTGFHGAPFAAINGHLRQEFNYGGSVNIEAGWAWRGAENGALLRAGFQHYNGPSMQWSFFRRYECLTGLGIWYDF